MNTDAMNTEPEDAANGEEPRLPATVRTLLERVQDQARERPLVILAAASGVGFVLGRGLPRFGAMTLLLGTGGLIGYAITVLRKRASPDDATSETTTEEVEDESADTSDDAHHLHVSSSMPDANRQRRKRKKPNVVAGG